MHSSCVFRTEDARRWCADCGRHVEYLKCTTTHFCLTVLSDGQVVMAPKTKGGKGKRSEKEPEWLYQRHFLKLNGEKALNKHRNSSTQTV